MNAVHVGHVDCNTVVLAVASGALGGGVTKIFVTSVCCGRGLHTKLLAEAHK